MEKINISNIAKDVGVSSWTRVKVRALKDRLSTKLDVTYLVTYNDIYENNSQKSIKTVLGDSGK